MSKHIRKGRMAQELPIQISHSPVFTHLNRARLANIHLRLLSTHSYPLAGPHKNYLHWVLFGWDFRPNQTQNIVTDKGAIQNKHNRVTVKKLLN